MRALTVSEINKVLIDKGYRNNRSIEIDPALNKWEADTLCFSDYEDGYSSCGLYKFTTFNSRTTSGCLNRIVAYNKLNAAEKKEFQVIIDNLPNNSQS